MSSILARARRRIAAATLVAGALAGAGASRAGAQDMAFSQAQLVRSLLPTVVNITARAEVSEPPSPVMASASQAGAAPSQIRVSAGSGFVIDPAGEIATNWHVVVGAFEIYVTFSDGSRVRAELLNASPLVDLAVLKVAAPHKLIAVRWADSKTVQVGDPVLAIGNPLGVGLSVSGGLVSALNRNIMDTPYDDFIQTDAAINHGNSGGPLFDLKGEVIGVNSALISPTSGNAGLGFAMPADDARFIFERLTKKVFARPGYIGVKLQQVTPDMAAALGMAAPAGSIVAGIAADSPAAHAGLRDGDVLLRIGTETPTDERALLRAIARVTPGATVPLGVRRSGADIEVPVKVEQWPTMWWEGSSVHGGGGGPHWSVPADLGLTVAPLTEAMRAQYMILPAAAGLLVTGVLPGTDAAQRGLAPGDVIEQVGDAAVASPDALQHAIERARDAKLGFALFLVQRKNQAVTPAQQPGAKWIALRVAAG